MSWLQYNSLSGAIEQQKAASFKQFKQIYDSNLESQVSKLKMAIEIFINDPKVVQAFAEGDRARLGKDLGRFFKDRLKPEFGIKQFQFHLPPATSFLRVHKLGKFGDDLSGFRKTVVQTNQSKTPTIGIEVGRAGPGVRVVYPVFQGEKHLGSVELGGSLSATLAIAQHISGVEYAIGIKKAVFEGARRFGDKKGDVLYKDLILYAFSDDLAREISQVLGQVKNQDLELGGKHWAVDQMEINDYSGQPVGSIFLYKDATETTKAMHRSMLTQILFILGAVVVSVLLLGSLLVHQVFEPLARLASFFRYIESSLNLSMGFREFSKDKTLKVPPAAAGENEIKATLTSFRGLRKTIEGTVKGIADQSITLAAASEELSATTVQIERTASEVQASIAVTNKAVAQSVQSAEVVDQNASDINHAMEQIRLQMTQANDKARNGEQAVQATVSAIEGISESSQKVVGLLGAISAIASQSKLLSLNAAIEAAKAGEAGKGFSVVAGEIRQLSEKSNHSVEQSRELIEASNAKVEEGSRIVAQTGKVFNEIVESVSSIAQQIGQAVGQVAGQQIEIAGMKRSQQQVAVASNENSVSMDELSAAVSEVKKTIGELSMLADELRESMASFTIE